MKKTFILFMLLPALIKAQNSVTVTHEQVDVQNANINNAVSSNKSGQFGAAGIFSVNNANHSGTALIGLHSGLGAAVGGTNSGFGQAGYFTQLNANNTSTTILSRNEGLGKAGLFITSLASNNNPALNAISNGGGYAIHATNTAGGVSGYFENTDVSNFSPALAVKTFGNYNAAEFAIDNVSNSNSALTAFTNGTGSAASFNSGNSATTFRVNQSSSGSAAEFNNTSNSNANEVLNVTNYGSGIAGNFKSVDGIGGYFENTDPANLNPALRVKTFGNWSAAEFSIDKISNSNSAITATTNGSGSAANFSTNNAGRTLQVSQSGSGNAAIFNNTSVSNTNSVLSVTNYGSGVAGSFSSVNGYSLITDAGNAGIGTATPDKAGLVVNKLVGNTPAIFGDNTSGVGIDVAWPGISFNGYYNAGRKPIVNGYVGGLSMDPSTGTIRIYTTATSGTAGNNIAATDKVLIDKDGNVAIGNGTPLEKLHVFGNLRVSGTICNTSGAITACSDVRYKKNFTKIGNPLQKIMALDGLHYDWRIDEFKENNFSEKRQIGFIAQEIEKIFPEMVYTDEKGYKSVDYGRLTPALVEAIKELKLMNDELKAKNEKLESRLDKIEAVLYK